jgi:hypothetical protein
MKPWLLAILFLLALAALAALVRAVTDMLHSALAIHGLESRHIDAPVQTPARAHASHRPSVAPDPALSVRRLE